MPELPQHIQDQIQAVREGRSTRLHLEWSLDELPEEVYTLRELQELDLRGASFRSFSDRLQELPSLRRIDVRFNPIERLLNGQEIHLDWPTLMRSKPAPESVWGVDISARDLPPDLEEILATLTSLPNLRRLTIDGDNDLMRSLANSVDKLPGVNELGLDDIRASEIPNAVQMSSGYRVLHFGQFHRLVL